MNCMREIRSGAVLEREYYAVTDAPRNIGKSKPKPQNIRTPEEKEIYNRRKSEKQFARVVCSSFTSNDYYVTLTYDDEHLPKSYKQALDDMRNYIRRLKYSNPNARIVGVVGYGKKTGQLHLHLIIGGVCESDIISKWNGGKIAKVEKLRQHNIYNGVDHGEDFTALAVYLHKHTPDSYKGRRWRQTKNLQQPIIKRAREVKREYTEKKPPKAPAGFMLVDVTSSEYFPNGYICFKYVRQVQEPLNIQPNFNSNSIKAERAAVF